MLADPVSVHFDRWIAPIGAQKMCRDFQETLKRKKPNSCSAWSARSMPMRCAQSRGPAIESNRGAEFAERNDPLVTIFSLRRIKMAKIPAIEPHPLPSSFSASLRDMAHSSKFLIYPPASINCRASLTQTFVITLRLRLTKVYQTSTASVQLNSMTATAKAAFYAALLSLLSPSGALIPWLRSQAALRTGSSRMAPLGSRKYGITPLLRTSYMYVRPKPNSLASSVAVSAPGIFSIRVGRSHTSP